jgi:hypothetical protein
VTGADENLGAPRHRHRRLDRSTGRSSGSARIRAGKHYAMLGVFAVLVLFVLWLAYNVIAAHSGLTDAREHATRAKAALISGDSHMAGAEMAEAQHASARAHNAAESVPWRLVAAIPLLGTPLRTGGQIVDVVGELTNSVLPPAIDAGESLVANKLRIPGGVDVAVLQRSAPALNLAAVEVNKTVANARRVDSGGYVGAVDDARDMLQAQVEELASLIGNTNIAAKLLPSMLGVDGPRNYILAFQTNAEARGTGGLVGGVGIVRAVQGALQVDSVASNIELSNTLDPMDLGPEFQKLYGAYDSTQLWQNSNISPNFPYAGQIWRNLWRQQSGETVDGAIATDPVALGYLLSAVGPVTMDNGEVIDDSNVVELTESVVYVRFGADFRARKDYLIKIAYKVIEKVSSGSGDSSQVLAALGRAASEGHFAVWSASPVEQVVIGDTPLGHAVPFDPAPYANVIVNNAGGNKLDYYLQRQIAYTGYGCNGTTRNTEVAITLTNTLPRLDLPDYVIGRLDEGATGPPGTNKLIVTLYGTWGAVLDGVTVDGRQVGVNSGSELGHPVFYVVVEVKPHIPVDVRFSLTEPSAPGSPRAPLQPLVAAAAVRVDVPQCVN